MKTALLIAVAGTTCEQAKGAFLRINGKTTNRFGPMTRAWAFTSAGVRRKLAAEGRHAPDVGEALSKLRGEGVTHLVVKPLHMAPGMEYGELQETLDALQAGPDAFERAVMGRPLLESEDDVLRMVGCVRAELPGELGPDSALVLVAHGSRRESARAVYDAAASACRRLDYPAFLGTMAPRSSLDSTLQQCRAAGVQRVYLAPFMVAAGYSARTEIAGTSPESWQSAFGAAGIECVPHLKGLGDSDGVVDIWLDQVENLLDRLTRARAAKRERCDAQEAG